MISGIVGALVRRTGAAFLFWLAVLAYIGHGTVYALVSTHS